MYLKNLKSSSYADVKQFTHYSSLLPTTQTNTMSNCMHWVLTGIRYDGPGSRLSLLRWEALGIWHGLFTLKGKIQPQVCTYLFSGLFKWRKGWQHSLLTYRLCICWYSCAFQKVWDLLDIFPSQMRIAHIQKQETTKLNISTFQSPFHVDVHQEQRNHWLL